MGGWVRIYRDLLDKPIWLKSTPEQKAILVTLLLMANHKENQWEWSGQKFTVAPGQFITSIESIRKAAGKGITTQNVRGALARFKKLDFLTNKSTKTGRLISIVNWNTYQSEQVVDQQRSQHTGNKEVTKTQQRGNKEVTTNKNERMKKGKNERKNLSPGDAGSKKSKIQVLSDYMVEQVEQHGLSEHSDLFKEFLSVRRENGKPVKTTRTIDGIIKNALKCRDSGYPVRECLEITMESGWQTPAPHYFSNIFAPANGNGNGNGGIQVNRTRPMTRRESNLQACIDFINDPTI